MGYVDILVNENGSKVIFSVVVFNNYGILVGKRVLV